MNTKGGVILLFYCYSPPKCPSCMKNTHLEHPEDAILTGDLSVLDWFSEPDSFISTKMDGAPAIVWGTNPATGKFFVGTKSVFNKVKIKINESHDDIDRNHSGSVADILHHCLDYLPDFKGIIQGDILGIDGSETNRPNTITYKFPNVVTEEIIIAPHTYYTADNDLRDAVAHPMKFRITDTFYCKFVQPKVLLTENREDIADVCDFARQMSTLCEFVDDKKAAKIKKAINTMIRNGENIIAQEVSNFHCVGTPIQLKSYCNRYIETAEPIRICFDLHINTFVTKVLNLRHNPQPQPQPPDPGSWICIPRSRSRGRSPLQRHRSMQIQDPGSGGCGCGCGCGCGWPHKKIF